MSLELVYISIALAAISLLLVLVLFGQNRKLKLRLEAQHKEMQHALESVFDMGKRIVTLQSDIAALNDKRQNQVDLNTNYKAYSQAAEMIQSGVPVTEVMARCKLSKGEAELLSAMTGRQK